VSRVRGAIRRRRPDVLALGLLLIAHAVRMRDFARIVAVDDSTGLSESLEFGASSLWRVSGQGYFTLLRAPLLLVSWFNPWSWALLLFGMSLVAWWSASTALYVLHRGDGVAWWRSLVVGALPLMVPVRLATYGDTTDVPFGLAYAHFPLAVVGACAWIALVDGRAPRLGRPIALFLGLVGLTSPTTAPVLLGASGVAWIATSIGQGIPAAGRLVRHLGPSVVTLTTATAAQAIRWATRSREAPAAWQALAQDYSPISHLRTVGLGRSLLGAGKSLGMSFLPDSMATWIRDRSDGTTTTLMLVAVTILLAILAWRGGRRDPASLSFLGVGIATLAAQSIAKAGGQVRYMIVPFILVATGITRTLWAGQSRDTSRWPGGRLAATSVLVLWAALFVTRFEVGANDDQRVRSWRGNLLVARDECVGRPDDTVVQVRVTVKHPDDIGLVTTCGTIR
jgi:hypothetical protein